jgi:hypothetical protein
VRQDADALIGASGQGAYDQSRTRAHEARLGKMIDANRPPSHWDKVRSEIARRTGRIVGVDTATRYLES